MKLEARKEENGCCLSDELSGDRLKMMRGCSAPCTVLTGASHSYRKNSMAMHHK